MYQGFHEHIKQHNMFSTLVIIRNISWASCEGSCDTEDWSDDVRIQIWSHFYCIK